MYAATPTVSRLTIACLLKADGHACGEIRMMAVDGSRKERKGYDIEQMASCDGMVHDGIGIDVPVRVFVGSSGEDAYPAV